MSQEPKTTSAPSIRRRSRRRALNLDRFMNAAIDDVVNFAPAGWRLKKPLNRLPLEVVEAIKEISVEPDGSVTGIEMLSWEERARKVGLGIPEEELADELEDVIDPVFTRLLSGRLMVQVEVK